VRSEIAERKSLEENMATLLFEQMALVDNALSIGEHIHQTDVIGARNVLEGLNSFAERFGNEFSFWPPARASRREQGSFSS
jgi:hypothetical protein